MSETTKKMGMKCSRCGKHMGMLKSEVRIPCDHTVDVNQIVYKGLVFIKMYCLKCEKVIKKGEQHD